MSSLFYNNYLITRFARIHILANLAALTNLLQKIR